MISCGSYNPSVIQFQNRLLLSYRIHDRNDWRTSLRIAKLDASLNPISLKPFQPPEELKDNSHEDARFLIHQGKLWISWSVSLWPATEFRGVIVYGQLLETAEAWTVPKFYLPNFGRNDFTAVEKNFVFWAQNDKLYCLYLTDADRQTILVLDGARVEEVLTSSAQPWAWGPIHGGAICPGENGNLLHFFNSRTGGKDRAMHRYNIGVSELSGSPPFETLRIARKPVVRGEEGVCLDGNKRYKANVVFLCGAIRQSDGWLISFGHNDNDCRLLKLEVKDLNL